jgi:hypothetical protein
MLCSGQCRDAQFPDGREVDGDVDGDGDEEAHASALIGSRPLFMVLEDGIVSLYRGRLVYGSARLGGPRAAEALVGVGL